MNAVWESPLSDTTRILYNNDKDYFKTSSYKELNEAYNDAKKGLFNIQPDEKLLNTNLNLFKPAPKDTDKIIEEFTMVEKQENTEKSRSYCSIM
jgi:hypothetical protein